MTTNTNPKGYTKKQITELLSKIGNLFLHIEELDKAISMSQHEPRKLVCLEASKKLVGGLLEELKQELRDSV